MTEQKFPSASTSINKTKLPAVFKKINWMAGDLNLDYGGGKYDIATKYLKTFNAVNKIYDPFNRSAEHNSSVLKAAGTFTSATLSNVLNVIAEPEVRLEVLAKIKSLLSNGAKLYITVYEGNKSGIGRQSKKDSWQNNLFLKDYLPEVLSIFDHAEIKNKMITAW